MMPRQRTATNTTMIQMGVTPNHLHNVLSLTPLSDQTNRMLSSLHRDRTHPRHQLKLWFTTLRNKSPRHIFATPGAALCDCLSHGYKQTISRYPQERIPPATLTMHPQRKPDQRAYFAYCILSRIQLYTKTTRIGQQPRPYMACH